jgi:hypothetical protein
MDNVPGAVVIMFRNIDGMLLMILPRWYLVHLKKRGQDHPKLRLPERLIAPKGQHLFQKRVLQV